MNCCGDCGSAYTLPRCSREGTRKSRAPSGVLFVSIGVSTSTNPCASKNCRIDVNAAVPRPQDVGSSRGGAGPGTGSGAGAPRRPRPGPRPGTAACRTSTPPRSRRPPPRPRRWAGSGSRFPPAAPAARPSRAGPTRPSPRTPLGARPAPPRGWATTWTIPSRSRRSRNTTPPWSRDARPPTRSARRSRRPAPARRSPHMCVRPPGRWPSSPFTEMLPVVPIDPVAARPAASRRRSRGRRACASA